MPTIKYAGYNSNILGLITGSIVNLSRTMELRQHVNEHSEVKIRLDMMRQKN